MWAEYYKRIIKINKYAYGGIHVHSFFQLMEFPIKKFGDQETRKDWEKHPTWLTDLYVQANQNRNNNRTEIIAFMVICPTIVGNWDLKTL